MFKNDNKMYVTELIVEKESFNKKSSNQRIEKFNYELNKKNPKNTLAVIKKLVKTFNFYIIKKNKRRRVD